MDSLTLSSIPQNRANYPAIPLQFQLPHELRSPSPLRPIRFTSRLLQMPRPISVRHPPRFPPLALTSVLPFPSLQTPPSMSSLHTQNHFIDTLPDWVPDPSPACSPVQCQDIVHTSVPGHR